MIPLDKGENKTRNKNKLIWQHPFRAIISGSSGTGKTFWLLKQLQNKDSPFDSIIWVAPDYSLEQQKLKNFYRNMKDKVDLYFVEGLDTEKIDEILNKNFKEGLQTAIVLDDLMYQENEYINNLFTSGRHKNASIIELTQRLFNSSKSRTNRLNTNYFVIFSYPDKSEFASLARQISPNKYKKIIDVYEQVTKDKHKALIIDLNTHTLNVKPEIKDLLKFRNTEWKNSIVNLKGV